MAQKSPVLDQLNLVVRNMDETVAFYRLLGLDIPERSVWRTGTGAHHVGLSSSNGFSLDLDSPALARVYNAGWQPPAGVGSRCVIGFRLESREAIDAAYGVLTSAGHRGLQAPFDAFWGARYAVVEDPDGNHVGLMSPSDPTRRSDPPTI